MHTLPVYKVVVGRTARLTLSVRRGQHTQHSMPYAVFSPYVWMYFVLRTSIHRQKKDGGDGSKGSWVVGRGWRETRNANSMPLTKRIRDRDKN
jgi:hypothetical protein